MASGSRRFNHTFLILTIIVTALLCYSGALPSNGTWNLQHCICGSHKVAGTRSVSALSSQVSPYKTSDDVRTDETSDPRLSKRVIVVQTTVEVPFSASVAFDAFSDFPRQAEFSPWLRKVEYLNPGTNMGETKWTMVYMGIVFSWNAFVTRVEYPNTLEWKSTTGMPNFGRVDFSPITDNNRTNVTMTMTFVAPRLVAALFRRSSALTNTVQNRIIRTTLINFRDAVQKDHTTV